jgi:hypothetical protein
VKKIKHIIAVSLFFIGIPTFAGISIGPLEKQMTKSNDKQSHALSLIGVVVSENVSLSIAVVKEGDGGRIVILKNGESISDLKLTHVFKNRIVLRKEMETYQVFIKRGTPINLSENNKKITKKKDKINVRDHGGPYVFNTSVSSYIESPLANNDYVDMSNEGPGGKNFNYIEQKNLLPMESEIRMRIPGPGEPGFRYIEQKNLTLKETQKKK